MPTWRSRAAPALALIALHLGLTMYFWLPEPSLATFAVPAWDLVVLVALLAAAPTVRERLAARRGGTAGPLAGWARRAVVLGATVAALAFVVLGFAQGFTRREFGYDVVVSLHARYVPELFRMLRDAEPLPWFVVYLAAIAGAVIAAAAVLYLSVRALVRAADRPRDRLVMAAIVVGYTAIVVPLLGPSGAITLVAYDQVRLAIELDDALVREAARLREPMVELERMNPFPHLARKPSIHVFIVEAYGKAVFDDPALRPAADFVESQGQALARRGFTIRSRYLKAPVFGGSSWMANASILCGARINTQKRYEALFTATGRCAPAYFEQAGYLTAIAAGNTTTREPRYARMFPFDRFIFRDDFGYRGRRFGWSHVPDQFVIDFVDDQLISRRREEPRFVVYQLASSHHPWSYVPPYIEHWSAIDPAGLVYGPATGTRYRNRFVDGTQHKLGYAQSIEYVMRSIATYVPTLPADTVVIILGDHQPRSPVADMKTTTWFVPVHVLGRDRAAIERFAALDYAPGMRAVEPPDPARVPGTWKLFAHVFQAFAPR